MAGKTKLEAGKTPAAIKARAFLAAFRKTGQVTKAAAAAGIDRTLHYKWLKTSKGYAAAFAQAEREAGDFIESEAVKRATEGWLEPIYYQGRQVGTVRRFDSGLTQFVLRGLKPERYGPKLELTGHVEINLAQRLTAARRREQQLKNESE